MGKGSVQEAMKCMEFRTTKGEEGRCYNGIIAQNFRGNVMYPWLLEMSNGFADRLRFSGLRLNAVRVNVG